MAKTSNLSLNLFTPGVDVDEGFQQYRIKLNGPTDSNMTLTDDFFGTLPSLISTLASNASGSKTTVTNTLSSISGSIVTINNDLDTVDARFVKLNEYSGSGQADFTSISSSYTHILILGVASADTPDGLPGNLGIDFNGTTTTASYSSIQWRTSGSYDYTYIYDTGSYVEMSSNGQIVVGQITGSYTTVASSLFFGSAFFILIPNYSSSGSFYKTALGMSGLLGSFLTTEPNPVGGTASLAVQAGYFKSTSSINRIRIFAGAVSSTTRYNFRDGTKISMYGLI